MNIEKQNYYEDCTVFETGAYQNCAVHNLNNIA